jgi:hypothetical protein
MRYALAAALSLGLADRAHAGRPMVTDDARILDAKACQLESWIVRFEESTEAWLVPACNPFGGVELAFGGARSYSHGQGEFAHAYAQAKTVLRELETDGWGAGLAVGTFREVHRPAGSGWPGDMYVNGILSKSFFGDAWVAHVNLGAGYERDNRRAIPTWGFGHEIRVREDFHFLPEMFAADRGRPFYQMSIRFALTKDFLLDASIGDRISTGSGERWYSIGFHYQTPPFIP